MKNRIKELRQLNNMTLLEVSKALGVAESTVQRYESGAIENLKYDTIVKLSNLLHTDPAYLMGWSDAQAIAKQYADYITDHSSYSFAGKGNDSIGTIIDIMLDLDDAGQEQLIQYGQFLLSQKEK